MVAPVILRSSCYLLPPGHALTRRWRAAATVENPAAVEHARLVRARVRSIHAPRPPATIETWRVIPGPGPWAGGTMIPRGLLPEELRAEVAVEIIDRRREGDPRSYRLAVELRPYQAEAIAAFVAAEDGVVVMPCGAGKTTMGIGAIARVGRRALVLVHTRDLAEQWIARIGGTAEHAAQLPGTRIGVVMGGQRTDDGADVVVATVQSLARWGWRDLYEWGAGFGIVVCDECHHAPAESVLAVLGGIPSRYRLGLTATPTRHDGLTELIWFTFGSIAYQVTRSDLVAAGAIRPAALTVHRTGVRVLTHEIQQEGRRRWRAIDAGEARSLRGEGRGAEIRPRAWAAQVSDLVGSTERNGQILALVVDRVAAGHSVVVLSERVEHCRALAAELRERGIAAEAVAGKQGRGEVAAILSRTRCGVTRVLCGTTKADEGLDVPRLSCGILATPTSAIGRVTQRLGRIERPGELAPEWIDLVDAIPSAARSAAIRLRAYRGLGMEGA